MNKKPRVLLTTSYGPNELGWGENMYDLATSRLARDQGLFRITSHMHHFGLFLIAENITNPTTVLENPHWEEFDRELGGGYDYVGFQLKSLHTAKIARMMKHIREKSPGTKIIIGGYGVSTLGQPVPGDVNGDAVFIRENADYLCREEGVGFMRRILDDNPVDREITQYHLPFCGMSLAGLEFAQVSGGIILVSLGCPNACDFCNTSAFFHNKKIYVAEPAQTYKFMKNYQRRFGRKDILVLLFDEDFFLNVDYVRELGRLIRSDKNTWGIKYFAFGSTRSVSQFTAEEIKDNGCQAVWIGVESFQTGENTTEDKYQKRRGKEIKELFADLHRHNIQTVGSLVLGFDFHNRENMKKDIDQFVALKPLLYQISPLTPCPGTPLYERMMEEGRLLDTYKWEDFHLWKDEVFQLKNLKKGEIKEFFDYAHRKLRDENGPQALQFLESALDAIKCMKDKTNEYHREQARKLKMAARGALAYVRAVKKLHPSPLVRERALMLERRAKAEIGGSPVFAEIGSSFIAGMIKRNMRKPPRPVVSDPVPRWSYYNTFDDRVWVKRGRKVTLPAPYREKDFLGLGRVMDRVISKYK